jgi:hypothetical protein
LHSTDILSDLVFLGLLAHMVSLLINESRFGCRVAFFICVVYVRNQQFCRLLSPRALRSLLDWPAPAVLSRGTSARTACSALWRALLCRAGAAFKAGVVPA